MNRTTTNRTNPLRDLSGLTLLETSLSIFFFAVAILTTTSVISRDMSLMTKNRVDFVGQTVVLKQMDFWRLQPYSAFSWSGCRSFTDPDLGLLPFGQGQECAEDFEVFNTGVTPPEARLRKLTVIARVFEQSTNANNPNIREWRATMLVYQDGINQQLGQ